MIVGRAAGAPQAGLYRAGNEAQIDDKKTSEAGASLVSMTHRCVDY